LAFRNYNNNIETISHSSQSGTLALVEYEGLIFYQIFCLGLVIRAGWVDNSSKELELVS